MRFSTILFLAVLLVLLVTSAYAIFPSKPIYESDGKPVPASKFVEEPRTIDGRRYVPGPTETIVVILVEFPADTIDCDTTAIADTCVAVTFHSGHDTTYYRRKIFNEAPGSNSMDKYWDECSNGMMDITGVVVGPFTMPHSMKYYGWDTQNCPNGTVIDDGWIDDAGNTDCRVCAGGAMSGSCRLIKDACDAADPYIDFCLYDTDLDGAVDHVIVVHAGKGQEVGSVPSHNIWSWFYTNLAYGPYDTSSIHCAGTNGVLIKNGIIVPEFYSEPDSFPLGAFCHEFSHSIGNPDLYDPSGGFANLPDSDDYPVADWCLMGHGSWCGPLGLGGRPSHLCGFNKVGTGWDSLVVIRPTPTVDTVTVTDSETSLGQATGFYRIDISQNEYFIIENRYTENPNINFDTYDSDWSDWTGHGGSDTLDCGLIITHSITVHTLGLTNNGACGYDYRTNEDTCECATYPYEIWIEDPGYDDDHNADWDEWWYPWEIKAGAAYASDDPHTVFDSTWSNNRNCTRTASSMDVSGNTTGIYLKAIDPCGSSLKAEVYVPGWVPPKLVAHPYFCHRWFEYHHGACSQGWTFYGPKPNVGAPYENRMRLVWVSAGATSGRSSPVVTNTEIEIAPGQTIKGLVIVASSDGNVYCYSARSGETVWSTPLVADIHTTPVACDTLYVGAGVAVELNRVYVVGPDARIYGLNLLTGNIERVWTEPTGNPMEAELRLAAIEVPGSPGTYEPILYIGTMAGTMYAINATTLTTKWDLPVGAPITCPVIVGKIPLPSAKGALAKEFRQYAIFFGTAGGDFYAVDAYSGGPPLWSQNLGAEIFASPAICDSVTQAGVSGYSDQIIVAATLGGDVFALDAMSGSVLWQFDAGSEAIASSPSVAVDKVHNWGMVWFQSTNDTVYALHLGEPRGGSRVIWKTEVPGGTASSPAVVLPYGMLPIGFNRFGEPIFPPQCATGDPDDDGVVYIKVGGGGGGGGWIYALDAARGTMLWDYDLPQLTDASPAPSWNTLYITSDALYAFQPDTVASIVGGWDKIGLVLELKPNPVYPDATIRFELPVKSHVSLRVYDIRGRLVRTIVEGEKSAGSYKYIWDGKNSNGRRVASGIYFVRLECKAGTVSKKLLLLD